jgi:SNF2 family DNA or RNA helicase
MALVPRSYQLVGAMFLALREGAVLGDEVGLGKTLQTLCAIEEVSRKADQFNALIIVPPSLKPQWMAAILEHFGVNAVANREEWAVVVPGKGLRIKLGHYHEFASQLHGDKKKPSDRTQAYLDKVWDLVVCDEVHLIKNRGAQRTTWIKRLRARRRWGLTGSPIAERPADLWSILNWLDRARHASYWTFVRYYCQVTTEHYRGRAVEKPGQVKDDQTARLLAEKLDSYLIRRTKDMVGIDLPPVIEQTVPVLMTPSQEKFYRQVYKNTIIDLTTENGEPAAWDLSGVNQLIIRGGGPRYIYLSQAASDPSVFKQMAGHGGKLDWLKEYVEAEGEPALILCRFNHTVEQVTALLSRADLSTKYIVGTYDKLGTGHNFQHLSTLIAWDPPASRLLWEQAVGRINRIGQQKIMHVYRLSAIGTINDNSWLAIDQKQDEVDAILAWLGEIKDARR